MERARQPNLLAWLVTKSLYCCADGSVHAPMDDRGDQAPKPEPKARTYAGDRDVQTLRT